MTIQTTTITELQRWGTSGWQWTAVLPDGFVVHCRTDSNGQGLWGRGSAGTAWGQSRGHMQFHLPAGEAAARRAIINHHNANFYYGAV